MTIRGLVDIGDENAPVGSSEWCKWANLKLRIQKKDTQSHVADFKYGLINFKDRGYWKQLHDRSGAPFLSWEDYVQCPPPYGLGMILTIADAVMTETDDRRLLADVYRTIDARDRANQRPAGGDRRSEKYRTNLYAKNGGIQSEAPTGTSRAAALRRLRKDRPDIHARVMAGEISAHAGMIEAGFRKPRTSRKRSALSRIRDLLPQLSTTDRTGLRRLLDDLESTACSEHVHARAPHLAT
jgi:hypothetical protein